MLGTRRKISLLQSRGQVVTQSNLNGIISSLYASFGGRIPVELDLGVSLS